MRTIQQNKSLEAQARLEAARRLEARLASIVEALKACDLDAMDKKETLARLAGLTLPAEVSLGCTDEKEWDAERQHWYFNPVLSIGENMRVTSRVARVVLKDLDTADRVVGQVDRLIAVVLPVLNKHLEEAEKASDARVEAWKKIG